MSFFDELRRRNVFRVGIAYLVVAWLTLQVTDIVVPILELPDVFDRGVLLLLATGCSEDDCGIALRQYER